MWQVNSIPTLCFGVITLVASCAVSAQALRDPTAPPRSPATAPTATQATTSIKLQAVVWRGEERTAIVNGQRVAVGDHVSHYIVQAIDMNQVTLVDTTTKQNMQLTLFTTVQHDAGHIIHSSGEQR